MEKDFDEIIKILSNTNLMSGLEQDKTVFYEILK